MTAQILGEAWKLKMADEEAEDRDQSLLKKSVLFPIISTNTEIKRHVKEVTPLFPSISVAKNQEKEPLDWLFNDSYSASAVEVGSKGENMVLISGIDKEPDGNSSNESLSSAESETFKRAKLEKFERKRDKKHNKKHKLKKHKKHKHKKQKVKEDEKLMKLPSTIWIEESGLEIEKAFRIHKKPDYDNCSFGALYRLDIALHKQDLKLKCLGLRPNQTLDLEKTTKKQKRQSQQRYWTNEYVLPDTSLVLCRSTSGKGSLGFSKNFSYVPLELPLSSGDKSTPGETSSQDAQVMTNELVSRTKILNERVREYPNDIEAWLSLADLQGKQVQYGDLTSDSLNKSGFEKHKKVSKLSLEKKAAVLEQAVEKNPSCVELIIAHMNVSMETITSDKIAEKWRNILFTQPQKTLLWKHYLMFCQSNFSAFSFSSTLAIYSKCFSTLSAIKEGFLKSHSPEEGIEVGMVEIFVQFCQFLRQTGHTEKAVAAYQALVEFICFHPKTIEEDRSMASSISFFETFWDSDVPRFGENDACGWDSWMEDSPENASSKQIPLCEIFASDASQTKEAEQEKIITAGLEKAFTWIDLEMFREANQWQPKKTSDENIEQEDLETDDPDRVVLFQDISSALFRISNETLKFQLLCYFLAFLGVPTELNSSESGSVSLQSLLQVLLEDDKQLACLESKNGYRFSCCWTQSESAMFPSPDVCMFIRNIFNQAMRVFSGELQVTLVAYWLRFEKDILVSTETNAKQRKQCYKAVRKLAKSLLKLEQHRNSLRLWTAFLEIEWTFGNMEEARRIVSSSLEQSLALTSVDPNLKRSNYYLVRSYCELEMGLRNSNSQGQEKADLVDDEKRNRILGTIAVVVAGNSTLGPSQTVATPSTILKTHRALQETSTKMLTDFHAWNTEESRGQLGQSLVDFMICYVLFEYWSLGIDAAKSVLDSLLSAFTLERSGDGLVLSGSKYHEEILVFYCKLLQFHARHGVCAVKPLRDLLLMALSIFRENVFFLDSYVSLELRSCVSTSVRRFFDRVLPDSQTPVPWLFAILYERRRQQTILSVTQNSSELFHSQKDTKNSQPSAVTVLPKSGVVHRLRSLYERAILHPSARHCVALWRSYINFEAENGELRQAKAIFYQALQCCAWAKALYVDAIKLFPDSLQDLHDLMEEKELRIRTPLDELDLLLES